MESLNRIAAITGTNEAAKATDAGELRNIMQELDALERSELSSKINYRWDDKFTLLLWPGLILLAMEIVLKSMFVAIMPE